MSRIIFSGIVVLVTALMNNTYCASFDCSKAESLIEKSICAIPRANNLDGKLNVLYKRTMAKLSPEAQKTMYYQQMQWLQVLLEKKLPTEIINAYEQRIAEIKQISQSNLTNIYSIKNKNITYQQIDAKDACSVKINKWVKNLVAAVAESKSAKAVIALDDLTVSIKQISNNIIKIESLCNYSGGAYPEYSRECYYFNKQNGKLLTAGDLFNFTKIDYLVSVMRQYISPECYQANPDYQKDFWPEIINAASITKALQDLRNVSLDKNILNLDLNLPHAVRAAGVFEVSNDKIKPFMSEFLRSELKL